jgi:histidinol-phosphate aminotransferase
MRAYSSARSLATQAKIYLDANESAWSSENRETTGLNRYPEPQPAELQSLLAELYGVQKTQLLIGRGSDEAIDVLLRAFCEARQDSILIAPPTYGVYEVFAEIQGAAVKRVPLLREGLNFRLNVPGLIAAGTPEVKIVFLCAPNNPTGTLFAKSDIEALLVAFQGKALVVVDEAYIEFASDPGFAQRIGDFENLVVLRTLSKAWSLAGARCGVAIGPSPLIEILQKVRAPYPLSAPAIAAVSKSLREQCGSPVQERIAENLEIKESFAQELSKLEIVEEIGKSAANFLLVRFQDAAEVMRQSRGQGLLIRDRSSELENCIRITIGSRNEMKELLACLRLIGAPRKGDPK